MIPSEIVARQEMIKRMIAYILDDTDKLSQWELSFVESVSEQFEIKSNLSDKQCEILEKIYDRM